MTQPIGLNPTPTQQSTALTRFASNKKLPPNVLEGLNRLDPSGSMSQPGNTNLAAVAELVSKLIPGAKLQINFQGAGKLDPEQGDIFQLTPGGTDPEATLKLAKDALEK